MPGDTCHDIGGPPPDDPGQFSYFYFSFFVFVEIPRGGGRGCCNILLLMKLGEGSLPYPLSVHPWLELFEFRFVTVAFNFILIFFVSVVRKSPSSKKS